MGTLSVDNAIVDHRVRTVRFLPGKPGDNPSINFRGYEDTGFWFDTETNSVKLRFSGTDVYTFDDTGGINVTAAAGQYITAATNPGYAFALSTNTGIGYRGTPDRCVLWANGSEVACALQSGGDRFDLGNDGTLSWSASGTPGGAATTALVQDAGGFLALRLSTTAMAFRVYNTFTDGSNYERAFFQWNSSTLEIGSEVLGTGTIRNMRIKGCGATGTIAIYINAADRWMFDGQASFRPTADVSYDIGTATPLFVRDIYVRRRVGKIAVITYSASMTPDAALGEVQTINATNGTAFTINAPSNPLTGQYMRLQLKNTSGGAMGAITWNAVFKMTAFTNPATATHRWIEFLYDGTNWLETDRSAADVPN